MAPVNKTALECVMEVDHERIKLEAEAERLAAVSDDDGKFIEKLSHRIFFCLFLQMNN
jgi:ATP-binding cassette subfamily F protein 2